MRAIFAELWGWGARGGGVVSKAIAWTSWWNWNAIILKTSGTEENRRVGMTHPQNANVALCSIVHIGAEPADGEHAVCEHDCSVVALEVYTVSHSSSSPEHLYMR